MKSYPSDDELIFSWSERLELDELSYGDTVLEGVCAEISYDHDLHAVVKIEIHADGFRLLRGDNNSSDYLKLNNLDFSVLARKVSSTISETSDVTNLELIPKRSPQVLIDEVAADTYTFKVVNGPTFVFKDFEFEFANDHYKVIYKEIYRKPADRKTAERRSDNIISGEIVVLPLSSSTLTFEEAFGEAFNLAQFLTFANGSYAGIGHCEGFKEGRRVVFAPGFNKFDPLNSPPNWFGTGQVKEASKINYCFQAVLGDQEADGEALRRCLDFYRASSAIRPSSIEMAIVSSSAALEVLVPHILSTRAHFDGSLLAERIPFHSKVRACFGIVGLNTDPLANSEELLKKASSLRVADAYEMSTLFRNRIVHQGKSFPVSGIELVEMWNFQMWMIEVLIFYLIDYRGTMQDRRPTTGWLNDSFPIPLD